MIQRTWWPRINPNAQLAKGLVFAGLGGGASTLQYADSSLYRHNGTCLNTEPDDWIFDQYLGRWCQQYDGSAECVSVPKFAYDRSSFAVSCWVNTSASNNKGILSHWSAQRSWLLELANTSWVPTPSGRELGFLLSTDGSITSTKIKIGWATSSNVADGNWHHVALHWSGGTPQLVIGGVSQSISYNDTPGSFTTVYDTSANIGVAAIDPTGSPTALLAGKIADFMMWSPAPPIAIFQPLADPSNTMLSGLILPPRRVVWPAAVAGTRYGWNTIYTSRGRLIKAS